MVMIAQMIAKNTADDTPSIAMPCNTVLRHEAPASSEDSLTVSFSFTERISQLLRKPYIDVHVVDHCNLRCRGCVHFAPLAKPRFLDLDAYERDLTAFGAIPGIQEYVQELILMGGEPLLHPKLPEVILVTRTHLPKARITLSSNGLLVRRMDESFWRAMRECNIHLYLSPYPIKVDYTALLKLAESHGVLANVVGDKTGSNRGKEVFYRLAIDPTGSQDPVSAHNCCPFGGCNMQLSRGRLWPCQVAAHHAPLNERFGLRLHDQPEDSLVLEDIVSTDQIEDFRRTPHPMCRYCDNARLAIAKWGISRKEAGEWVAKR